MNRSVATIIHFGYLLHLSESNLLLVITWTVDGLTLIMTIHCSNYNLLSLGLYTLHSMIKILEKHFRDCSLSHSADRRYGKVSLYKHMYSVPQFYESIKSLNEHCDQCLCFASAGSKDMVFLWSLSVGIANIVFEDTQVCHCVTYLEHIAKQLQLR